MTRPTILCLLGMLLLAGCPAPPSDKPAAPASAPAPAGAASPAAPAKPGTPQPRVIPLEINGIRLNWTLDDLHAVLDEQKDEKAEAQWQEVGTTGILHVRLLTGAAQPAEDFYIKDGKLVGYIRRFLQQDGDYVKSAEGLALQFDPGTVEPPAWAKDLKFVKDLPPLGQRDARLFWDDAAAGQLLVIQRFNDTNHAVVCLFEPQAAEAMGLDYAAFANGFGK